jgi:hypothetical protein
LIYKSPKSWLVLSLVLFVLGLAACSAMPAFQGDIDEVRQDQAAAAESAESGNLLRTVLFSLSGAAGAIAVALRKVKSQDAAPFAAKVDGREVTFTEDELGKVVENARKGGIV